MIKKLQKNTFSRVFAIINSNNLIRKKLTASLTILLFFLSNQSFAAGELSQSFTLDGQLLQAGNDQPLLDATAKIKIQILDPSKTCLLYEEEQTVDTTTSNGYYNIQVGSNTGAGKRTGSDPGRTMIEVFQNSNAISAANAPSQTCTGSTYTPSARDSRYFRVIVTPSATNIADTLTPDAEIGSVSSALVAQSLQGKDASQFIQTNTTAPAQVSQSNLENIFSTTNYPILTALLAGTSSLYNKPAANGTNTLPSITTPSSPVAGQIWYDSGVIKYFNGTSEQTLGVSGSGITSLTAGTGLTGGTITSSGTIAVDVGTTAGKILQLDGSAKIPAVDGSQLTNLNGSAITSGTIGGSTAISTTGTISSGAITSTGSVSSSDVRTNAVRVYKPSTANYVELVADSTLAAAITLTLPTSVGGSGQVLQSNGSGVLSWVTPTSGTITSLTGDVTASGTGSVAATIATGAVTTGKILDGTIAPADLNFAGTMATNTGLVVRDGSQFYNKTCSGNETLIWSVANGWICSAVTLSESDPQVGSNTTNYLSKWDGSALVASGVYESGGNVGIGTTSPGRLLDLYKNSTTVSAEVGLLRGDNTNQHAGYIAQPAGTLSSSNVQWESGLHANRNNFEIWNWNGSTELNTLAISNTGNVGIGTTSPASPLQVRVGTNQNLGVSSDSSEVRVSTYDDAAVANVNLRLQANDYRFFNAGAISEVMTIKNSGNVGIGTSSPNALLHVSNAGNSQGILQIDGNRNGSGASASIIRLGAPSSPANANTRNFEIANVNGSGATPNFLSFAAQNDTYSGFSNLVAITQNGNVGIGTTSPSSDGLAGTFLDISHTGDQGIVFSRNTANASYGNGLILFRNTHNTAGNQNIAEIVGVTYATGADKGGELQFRTKASGVANVASQPPTRMTISHIGNVGIGTTSPGDALHVAGKIRGTHICYTDGTNCKDLSTAWAGGGGTVTSVTAGTGLTGGTITGSGTIGLGTELAGLNALSTTGFVKRTAAGTYSTASIDLTSDITGTLPVANGGTGATTPAAAINNLLPSQTGNGTKILQTDGTNVSWVTTPTTGITALTGDVTASGTGSVAATIATGAVTTGKILDGTIAPADLNFAGTMTTNTGLVVRDGSQFYNKTCSGNETLIWSVANGWICSAVTLSESDPQVGSNTTNYLSKWDGSALVTSGVFESSGNVGIGTNSPQRILHVAGTSATVVLERTSEGLDLKKRYFNSASGAMAFGKFSDDMSTSAEHMRIDSSGNVGIGTASPGVILDVNSSSSNINTGRFTCAGGWCQNIVQSSTVIAEHGANSTDGLTFFGSNSNHPAIFRTNSLERMRIDTSGNVGIGTSSPQETVEINKSSNPVLSIHDTSTSSFKIGIDEANSGVFKIAAMDNGYGGHSGSFTANDTQVLTMSQTGNVGIGTTNPVTPLNVNGNAFFGVSGGSGLGIVSGDNTPTQVGSFTIGSANTAGYNWIQSYNGKHLSLNPLGNNVGIGTTSPGNLLHLQSAAQYAGLTVSNATNSVGKIIGQTASNDSGALQLFTGGTLTAQVNTIGNTFFNGGNVGIGTTSPGSKLDVSGNILMSAATPTIQMNSGGPAISVPAANTMTFSTSGSEKVRIDPAGNVGIGVTSPSAKLHVVGSATDTIRLEGPSGTGYSGVGFYKGTTQQWVMHQAASNDRLYITDSDGSNGVYLDQNASSWSAYSDIRLKKNIREYSVLDKLKNYRAVSYDWKSNNTHDVGVIAQELYAAFPEIVDKGSDQAKNVSKPNDDGIWGVHYDRLGALALQAVKELYEKVFQNIQSINQQIAQILDTQNQNQLEMKSLKESIVLLQKQNQELILQIKELKQSKKANLNE